MSGPVFHKSDFPYNARTFPEYFENKAFVYEWERDWMYTVTVDEHGQYVKADRFLREDTLVRLMDMRFGSDGQLYLLEYGQAWNKRNLKARLSRIRYLPGNRPPIALMEVSTTAGQAPLTLTLSGAASHDYDRDSLSYFWSGEGIESVNGKEVELTITTPGHYTIELTVTDGKGATSSTSQEVLVGNAPP